MPTLLNEKGFKFFFYSEENNEPCHIHVEKGSASGKIWLEPGIENEYLRRFTNAEERDVMGIIKSNIENLKENGMNTSNKYDSIESLIFETGLRISSIAVDKAQDSIIVLLNSGISISAKISKYKFFSKATQDQLANYRLIADGVGINWPDLDEDLSLKGFLREELKKLTGVNDTKPDGSSTSYAMAA